MDIILELADKIRGRIVILKDSYFALVEDSKGKIETNNNKINDLSAQIDQITGEIAKLSEETKRVQEDYGSIEGNLNEAKKDSGEYGLINGSAIEEIIKAATKKRDQFLSDIENTLETLNSSLGDITDQINTLSSDNESLEKLLKSLESSYNKIIAKYEKVLTELNSELEDINLGSAQKEEPVSTKKDKKEDKAEKTEQKEDKKEDKKDDVEQKEDKKDDVEQKEDNLIDLSALFADKFARNTQAEVVNEPRTFDQPFMPVDDVVSVIPLVTAKETTDLSLTDLSVQDTKEDIKTDLSAKAEEQTPSVEVIKEDNAEVIEAKLEEPKPVVVQSKLDEKPVAVDVQEEPKLVKIEPNLKDRYVGLAKIGFTEEQELELMSKLSPDQFIKITNVLQNYGISIENLIAYYGELLTVEDARIVDETLSLLRSIGKNNDLDFSLMLDEILLADPTNVQENILNLYKDGKDPISASIMTICSSYYNNINLAKQDGLDGEMLAKRFPYLFLHKPYLKFISDLKGKGSSQEPERSKGGMAA